MGASPWSPSASVKHITRGLARTYPKATLATDPDARLTVDLDPTVEGVAVPLSTLSIRSRSAARPRTLIFVNTQADAGPPEPSREYVVLDTSWTPGREARPDLIPVRTAIRSVLERINLFEESLALLDSWADEADAPARMTANGVTWWLHARSFISLRVHEVVLWCHVLAHLAPPGRHSTIVIPAARTELVDAAMAWPRSTTTPKVVTVGVPVDKREPDPTKEQPGLATYIRQRAVRAPGGIRRRLGLGPGEMERRLTYLHARIDALAREPHAVLALVQAPSFHTIGDEKGRRRSDPYVASVLDRLADDGHSVIIVALELDHRSDADWKLIKHDERLLPSSIISRRWSLPEDGRIHAATAPSHRADLPDVDVSVDGFDIGPMVRRLVARYDKWFDTQRNGMTWAERLLLELRPSVLFTGWEAARTSWLGAASQLGVPSVAVQHGVIYSNSPDYCRPAYEGLVRPDVTCVYGPYERDILIREGGYDPDSVIVTGSPRIEPDRALVPGSPDERASVRRELGVVGDDRLLVVSAARRTIGNEIHGMSALGQLLAGPLPGVHVAFKLHPEEKDGNSFVALVAGLALAGGYQIPRMSVVRDIDLYRLLRSADAHLGQYSTVLNDAVLTGTPNMIAVGPAWADIIGYIEAGVATPVRTADDVRAFMQMPRPPKPEDRARFLEAHYRSGDATGRIAAAITAAAAGRKAVTDG